MGGVCNQRLMLLLLRQLQHPATAAVRAQQKTLEIILSIVGGFQHQSSRGIAEQHAGAPVIPVHPAAELIRSNHQDPAHGTGSQVLSRRDDGEEKSTAGCRQIERRCVGGTEGTLQAGSGTEEVVGG